MTQTRCPFGSGYDFTDPDVLVKGIPVTEFAELRKTAPVWWNEQTDSIFEDGGYWVISRHADIKEISRNGDLWSTNRKGVVMRLPDGTNAEQLELTKALLINHDAPEHTRLRKIVSRLFTPRAVTTLEEKLAVAAREIVAAAAEKESGNFVDDIAMSLPLLAIADLIGVPEADRAKLFHWTNSIMNTDDPDYETDYAAANAELMGYAYTMAEERRRCPADDIVTRLIEADIDGESMDDVEFAFFVILLAVAGNETTRNAMTHGMNAFFENPDQWELYKRDRPATSADTIRPSGRAAHDKTSGCLPVESTIDQTIAKPTAISQGSVASRKRAMARRMRSNSGCRAGVIRPLETNRSVIRLPIVWRWASATIRHGVTIKQRT